MKHNRFLHCMAFSFALSFSQTLEGQTLTARALIDKMTAAMRQVQGMSYELLSKERNGDTYREGTFLMKAWFNPRQFYVKVRDTGVELLYMDGWNDNKVLVNPNGFPWMNVSLNPWSDRMQQDNHHTLFDTGFDLGLQMIQRLDQKIREENLRAEQFYRFLGEIQHNGRSYYQLYIVRDDFGYTDYTLDRDETPYELGKRFAVPAHLIEERNGLGHGKIRKGKVIKMPTAYAKKVVYYIDKTTFLPYVQYVYDEKGLYEYYEYSNVKINPRFAANEFSKDFPEYGF